MGDRNLEMLLEDFLAADDPREKFGQERLNELKRRIRPAAAMLIDREDVEGLMRLEKMGWFGSREVEGFIKTARDKHNVSVLMWLLHLKNEKYPYEGQDFSL